MRLWPFKNKQLSPPHQPSPTNTASDPTCEVYNAEGSADQCRRPAEFKYTHDTYDPKGFTFVLCRQHWETLTSGQRSRCRRFSNPSATHQQLIKGLCILTGLSPQQVEGYLERGYTPDFILHVFRGWRGRG